MGDNWEEKFSSYDIDRIKAENSKETEQISSAEDSLEQPAPVLKEQKELELESTPVERFYAESEEALAAKAKVEENKAIYDRLLSKFTNKEPRILKKEDVEQAVAQMEECIAAAQQLPESADAMENSRQSRKRRIVNRQLTQAVDVFATARYIGSCFLDINQKEFYQYLDNCRYTFMTSMAVRTFRSNHGKIFEAGTSQQSKDAIDKIMASAERLAFTLAEIINSFPGEGGLSALLEMMVEKDDDHAIDSIGQTIRMAAKGEL